MGILVHIAYFKEETKSDTFYLSQLPNHDTTNKFVPLQRAILQLAAQIVIEGR